MSLYEKIMNKQEKISLIGLGYVGMPLVGGFCHILRGIDDLTDKLEFMINNTDLIYQMKRNCLKEAKKYNADFVSANQ